MRDTVVVASVGMAEDLIGNEMELVVDGAHHALHGFLNGLDTWCEGTGPLLGVTVDGSDPHEEELSARKTCNKNSFFSPRKK